MDTANQHQLEDRVISGKTILLTIKPKDKDVQPRKVKVHLIEGLAVWFEEECHPDFLPGQWNPIVTTEPLGFVNFFDEYEYIGIVKYEVLGLMSQEQYADELEPCPPYIWGEIGQEVKDYIANAFATGSNRPPNGDLCLGHL